MPEIISLTPELLWLILMIAFIVIEAATISLVSIWFALGSLVGLIAAVFNAPLWLQISLFVLVSGATLLLTKPLVKKFVNSKRESTNLDRVLEKDASVTEEINNLNETGTVYVDGKEWTARSSDGSVIQKGTVVKINKIEGVKAFVSRCSEEEK